MSVRLADEWAPLFTQYFLDTEILKPGFAVSNFTNGTYCKLCDAWFTDTIDAHVQAHAEDFADWRSRQKEVQSAARAARLAEVRKEKTTEVKTVGAQGLTRKQLVSRMRNVRWKLAHPEKHKREAWSASEKKDLEDIIAAAVAAIEKMDKEGNDV